jgi:cell division protein FtsW (lipid II flippase)
LARSKRAVSGYQPMPRGQRHYNALLTLVNIVVTIVMLLVLQADASSAFITLGLGILTAGLLAYSSSLWGTLSAAVLSIAGPPLLNATLPGAEIL